ncbi:50S ribosomal protein L6P [Acidilobus saccharovorans 345-15]|uniref:Large ribosomal subunit protein uL6 n=1 Tax=Acidilobus saccharovorans (strain DSM 16705 / JCM 18335 / VKM B-2471 / 345-15) TaxID=666510 RepID=D9Q2T7_ACIS3|nr:50S ribosomal protein L6 [Acidilobus saccharovorans]ADL19625.1 50S ribosomal protein L6P [Acidilobus saccharovorans 345-15]
MPKALYVKREVEVPQGVTVRIEGLKVTVKGPKGEVQKDFSHARGVELRLENNKVIVEARLADTRTKALVGTVAAHIKNMITGVSKGFRYKLKIISTHFPITVKVEKSRVVISNFLGEKAPRYATIMPGVTVKVQGQDIIVEGSDVEAVGQTAANIERATHITDFDRRKFMDGIFIYSREVAS